jgi:2-isopropylmalate synthase
MDRVLIFDTTLRDGEQSPGASMTAAEKVRMAHQLDALGVDIIEAGFPISSPAEAASVRAVAAEVRRPIITALARANQLDIECAAAAIELAQRARLHVFIGTSDLHLERKLRMTRAECLDRTVTALEIARRYVDDVEFSAEDATRSDLEFLAEIVQAAITAGATTINLPDTVGYTYPSEYAEMFRRLREAVPAVSTITLSAHCHNDLGLAVANSLASLDAGVRQVECTINGIGERAGNAALEEIVMALRVRADAFGYGTAIESREIYRSSHLLSQITGIHTQPNKAIVGRNAFAHEAGIHQDGVLKSRLTYEIMTPESVGVPGSNLVLGKHSGRSALAQRYRTLGYELDGDDLARVYDFFKQLADRKRIVLDEDLLAILHHGCMDDVPHHYRLRALEVTCGEGASIARIRLEVEQREAAVTAQGDGPIAAAFAAIDSAVAHRIELKELNIQAITPGSDAVGEVVLHVDVDGKSFRGSGASPDVVNASVRAYLNALNKAVHAQKLEQQSFESTTLWGV